MEIVFVDETARFVTTRNLVDIWENEGPRLSVCSGLERKVSLEIAN